MVAEVRGDYVEALEASLELFQERIAELEFAQEDWGWTRLGGDAQNEFSRDHLRKMISKSRLFYLQNPLIRRAVTLEADYVFAQGVTIQGTSESVNTVIQEFLDDPGNKREFSSHSARLSKERTQKIDGNIFFVLFTDKQNTGKVNIRSIMVDEITDIISNPDDSNDVWFYKREWMPVNENGVSGELQSAYYPDINYMPRVQALPKTGPIQTGVGSRNDIPIYWDAPIIHVKTGALEKSRFGAPETYPALNWARSHSQMLDNWASIVAAHARFAFRLTTPGNKSSVVAARNKFQTTVGTGDLQERNPAPTVGSVFVRQKDGADIEPIKTAGATTSARDARELRIMVAAAMGLPDPMLSGEVDVGNLATAKTLDRPTELKFRSRQKMWEDVYQQIINWVIRWQIEAPLGRLNKLVRVSLDDRGEKVYKPKNDPKTKKPIDLHVEVVFPPILERTVQERIDAVIGAVTLNGKTFAVDSPEFKKLTIRLMLQALGLSDVDELVELIFQEINDDDLKDDTEEEPVERTEIRV